MKKLPQKVIIALFTVLGLLFSSALAIADNHFVTQVYAEPDTETNNYVINDDDDDPEDTDLHNADLVPAEKTPAEDETENDEESESICQGQAGSASWAVCSVVNTVSNLVDSIYEIISEHFLVVEPLSTDTDSTIFQVWSYMRELTNIIFIVFIVIVIYSQLTGLGIDNYGIKRVLPRLIIATIMVNLSYIICAVLVDLSNLIGSSANGFFGDIIDHIQQVTPSDTLALTWGKFASCLTGGISLAAIGLTAIGGGGAIFWMALVSLIGGAISLIIGLITVSLRQGVISVLIMISPLAFVAYLLPNTEKWFTKWKDLLAQMLFFYPMFAFLFGASKLSGWAIITNGMQKDNGFEVLLGMAIQVLPLCLSVSLLKMSNSVLGKISSGLDRLSNPARNTLGTWGNSHIDKARQHYLRNNHALTGARLRNYLAERQKRRELDIANTRAINEGRINTRALNRLAGYAGRDKFGNDIYKKRPNADAKRAKEASLQATLAANAQKMLDNNLSQYGDLFKSRGAQKLAGAHAEAYVDSMKQSFRAENIAQSDQTYLLTRFIDASKHRSDKPYEFNRLIRSANGGLGLDGESTIMGQVLRESVEIEGRNRRDALVVANKFNFSKPEWRAFAFDVAEMSDAGFEIGVDGKPVEDDQYNLLPGKQHRPYEKYIGVHKDTGQEISKERYDSLSAEERRAYKRVRYMDITDDDGDTVQRFTENDAGYMKEMLARDIFIGDPINNRYNVSYGFDGPLRRYHSTISAAMVAGKYKEHAVEVGQMLTQHLNMGYVDTPGKYNIACLQAAAVATKPKDFLINDKDAFKRYQQYFECLNDDEKFHHYFPDSDITGYLDVNGKELSGLRFDTENQQWKDVPRSESSIDDLRNTIKHKILPKTAKQFISFLKHEITPNVRENQKSSGVAALMELANLLGSIALDNQNPNLPIEQRMNPDVPLFGEGASQPNTIIKDYMSRLDGLLQETRAREGIIGNGFTSEGLSQLNRDLDRKNTTGSASSIASIIHELVSATDVTNPQAVATQAQSLFSENEELRRYAPELDTIIESTLYGHRPSSVEESIRNTTNPHANDADKANALREQIESLYNGILGSSDGGNLPPIP